MYVQYIQCIFLGVLDAVMIKDCVDFYLQAVFFFVSLQLKRKSARVAALERQLQEKTSAYSQSALTNTELENQLLVQHTPSLFISHIVFFLISSFIKLPDPK